MESNDDWKFLGKIRKIETKLDDGADSTVYPLTKDGKTTSIAKLYDGTGFSLIKKENHEQVLKEYYKDTERAAQIIEDSGYNPLEQSIYIDGEIFPLHYEIVPQGALILENTNTVNKEKKALVGQKFITGLNLSLLRNGKKFKLDRTTEEKPTETQEIFMGDYKLCTELDEYIEEVFYYLSRKLDVNFNYGSRNAKPFIDNEKKEVVIFITDLCTGLRTYYEENPKFKALRKEK